MICIKTLKDEKVATLIHTAGYNIITTSKNAIYYCLIWPKIKDCNGSWFELMDAQSTKMSIIIAIK